MCQQTGTAECGKLKLQEVVLLWEGRDNVCKCTPHTKEQFLVGIWMFFGEGGHAAVERENRYSSSA